MPAPPKHWEPLARQPVLGSPDVHVWRVSLDLPMQDRSLLESLLSDEERARADRFATDKLRNRFVVSRGVTRQLLGAYAGQDPKSLHFRLGEHDKPYLTGDPNLTSLQFNVSHSGDLGLVAVTRGEEIGVDLEWVRSNLDQIEIAARFFSANETARLRDLSGTERLHHFFELWTCKEAFVKAQGGGISFGLNRFEVLLQPESDVASILEETGDPSPWIIHQLDPAPGCLGALAVPSPEVDPVLLEWIAPSAD